jgi:hypothetical protein
VLSARSRQLLAILVPRVRGQWPAIAGIALAVVLAHSGVRHLDASIDLVQHYRTAIGDDWTRGIGILQLAAAGGLCFARTRAATASALVAVLLIAIANQWRSDRLALASFAMLAWAAIVAWGESRRR